LSQVTTTKTPKNSKNHHLLAKATSRTGQTALRYRSDQLAAKYKDYAGLCGLGSEIAPLRRVYLWLVPTQAVLPHAIFHPSFSLIQ
jgi:hypothetical protein